MQAPDPGGMGLKVSVIMPAYNASRYIGEAIESILGQSFADFELIIVDDASTDDTWEIVQGYASKDQRIQAVRNQQNLNIAGSLNRGIGLARGELIARMDADDIAFRDRLERQVSFLRTRSDVGLCGMGIVEIFSDGVVSKAKPIICGRQAVDRVSAWCQPVAHPTWMMQRSVYRSVGEYRNVSPAEDYDFLLRALEAEIGIDNIPEYGLYLRLSETNSANTRGLFQRKAVNYVLDLRRQRRLCGHDDYSAQRFERAVRSSAVYARVHGCAQSMFSKAIGQYRNRNPLFFAYALAAAVLSPHMAQFLLRNSIVRLFFKTQTGIKRDRFPG
jgi:glycosyltransferase involved in cell wall biosynthesis